MTVYWNTEGQSKRIITRKDGSLVSLKQLMKYKIVDAYNTAYMFNKTVTCLTVSALGRLKVACLSTETELDYIDTYLYEFAYSKFEVGTADTQCTYDFTAINESSRLTNGLRADCGNGLVAIFKLTATSCLAKKGALLDLDKIKSYILNETSLKLPPGSMFVAAL